MTEQATTASAPTLQTVRPGESGTPTQGGRVPSGSPPGKRERPGDDSRAIHTNSVGGEFSTSVPESADFRAGVDGFQRVHADGPLFDNTTSHWTDADIQHAYSAGIEAGHAAGMCAHLRDEFDGIADAVALLDWVEARIRATSKHGPEWANYAVGPRPPIGGGRS